MNQTTSNIQIRNAIKVLLKKHGLSYRDLGKALELSEGAIKQLMTKGSFTTSRLEKVAHWFGYSLFEFMEIALKAESRPYSLSHKQEEILFGFPVSMWMLFLLSAGFPLESIRDRMNLTEKKFQLALHTLDKTGLIELLPGNRVRIKFRGPYRFNKNGIIEKNLRKDYLALVTEQIQFGPPPDVFQRTFEMYFSESLFKKMKLEVEAIISKYGHLTRIETELDQKDRSFPVTGVFFMKPFDGWGTLLSSKK